MSAQCQCMHTPTQTVCAHIETKEDTFSYGISFLIPPILYPLHLFLGACWSQLYNSSRPHKLTANGCRWMVNMWLVLYPTLGSEWMRGGMGEEKHHVCNLCSINQAAHFTLAHFICCKLQASKWTTASFFTVNHLFSTAQCLCQFTSELINN